MHLSLFTTFPPQYFGLPTQYFDKSMPVNPMPFCIPCCPVAHPLLSSCSIHVVQVLNPCCPVAQLVLSSCSICVVQLLIPCCPVAHSLLSSCSIRVVQLLNPCCPIPQSPLSSYSSTCYILIDALFIKQCRYKIVN